MKPHLFHVFATFAPGGPQVRTARIVNALAGEFRHSILAMDGHTEARELLASSTDPDAAPGPARGAGNEVEVRFFEPPRKGALRAVPYLRRLLRRESPDLLLTYNWGAIEAVLAGLFAGVPILHHEDGFRADEAAGFKRRRTWARRLLLQRVNGVIVPSRKLEKIALELWKLPRERVHYVPNGIRIEDFPPRDGNPELRAKLGIPRDAFVVGSVGHLRPEKNFVRLVEAFALLALDPPARLLLVGEGPERANIERRARELGVLQRVHLVGYQPRAQPFYQAMDVFALSSDTEQMPVALLEAMASALPVVATDVGDVDDIVPEEARHFLVSLSKPDAAGALSRALAELARDPDRAPHLSARDRERVRSSFSFDRMLAAHRRLYSGALESL